MGMLFSAFFCIFSARINYKFGPVTKVGWKYVDDSFGIVGYK